jgi:hypothetical protein
MLLQPAAASRRPKDLIEEKKYRTNEHPDGIPTAKRALGVQNQTVIGHPQRPEQRALRD